MNAPQNSTENLLAFSEKVKKQAKSLLKIAKNNNLKVEVLNLSQAQNLIAQINGYPDFHALNKTISNTLNKVSESEYIVGQAETQIDERIFISQTKGIHILESDKHLISFFDLNTFPITDNDSAKDWIANFKEKVSFKWNMSLHESKILFDFYSQEEKPTQQYSFFKWSNLVGLTKEQFDKIFSIDLKPTADGFCLKVICAIITNKDQIDEHIAFCKDLKPNFFNRNWISKNDLSLLQIGANVPSDVLKTNISEWSGKSVASLKNLISINDNDTNVENLNWLFGLQAIYNKKKPIKLVASIADGFSDVEFFPQDITDNGYGKFLNALLSTLNKKIYKTFEAEKFISLKSDHEQSCFPWDGGIPFINKTDGNISHIQLGTTHQINFNNFIYAKPGSGKSSLMNLLHIDSFLRPGVDDELPYLGIVDIGPSSRGLIEFFKNSLSADKREQIIYHKLTLNDHINPFDTELGCRRPDAMHNHFLINFLLLLAFDQSNSPTGLSGLIQMVINLVYKKLADGENPNFYQEINSEIQHTLTKINYKISSNTTWWKVVDALFEEGYIKEAKIAQTYASPKLPDILSVLNDSSVRDIYGKVTVNTGENLVDYLKRNILLIVKEYPSLSKITNLNFENAKVIAIDLDNVAKSFGFNGSKQTAIMYSLSSFFLAKHSKLYLKSHYSESDNIPSMYEQYFKEEQNKHEKKLAYLCFDEYHRACSFENVYGQIACYFRESRKYGFSFTLATQSLQNSEALSHNSSSVFAYTNSLKEYECEQLDIKDKKIISDLSNPKNNQFGDLVFRAITKQERIEKILSFKINPFIHWSISANYEDSYVRTKAIEKLGYFEAIVLLAEKHPKGIKIESERLKEASPNKSPEDVLEHIAKQILSSK